MSDTCRLITELGNFDGFRAGQPRRATLGFADFGRTVS